MKRPEKLEFNGADLEVSRNWAVIQFSMCYPYVVDLTSTDARKLARWLLAQAKDMETRK